MLGKDRDGTEQTHELEDTAKENNMAGSLPRYQKSWAGWLIGQATSCRVATQVAGSQQGKLYLPEEAANLDISLSTKKSWILGT